MCQFRRKSVELSDFDHRSGWTSFQIFEHTGFLGSFERPPMLGQERVEEAKTVLSIGSIWKRIGGVCYCYHHRHVICHMSHVACRMLV